MATVEYIALAALVSLVLAVGGATGRARQLPDAVGAQLRKAYCLVAGGDCLGPGGPRPCVVSSRSDGRELRASVAFVRLADGRVLLREDRSDGTVALTVLESSGAGGAMQGGLKLRL